MTACDGKVRGMRSVVVCIVVAGLLSMLGWAAAEIALAGDPKEDDEEFQRRQEEVLKKGEDILGDFLGTTGKMGRKTPAPPGACAMVRVSDNVGRPIDGQVTLRRADGVSRTLTTVASRGTLCDLAPGRYTVTLNPRGRVPPPPRTLEIRSRSERPTLSLASGPPLTPPAEPRSGGSPSSPPLPSSPWLGAGRRLAAQGQVVDAAGRPMDGVIRVYRDSTEIGYVTTVAGRFSLFDLPRGEYRAVCRGRGGAETARRFTIGSSIIRLSILVP
jgi:hypothetical protein